MARKAGRSNAERRLARRQTRAVTVTNRTGVLPDQWIPRISSSQLSCPVCGHPMYIIGLEPNGGPLYVCWDHQKTGVLDHVDRYTGLSQPPPHHFDYFTLSTLGEIVKYGDGSRFPGGLMDPEERLWFLDLACSAFLSQPDNTDYVVFQSGTDWCHSIQCFFHEDIVELEVNPRHWDPCLVCRNEPLPPMAIASLRRLGFSNGEPGTNFALDGLPPRASELAWFIERLFRAAFNEQPHFAVGVRFRHGDVAQAFLAARSRPGWPSESESG